MSINTLFFLISLIGAILGLLKVAGWLGKASYNIVKWGAYTILGVLIIWGIYNTIGTQLHLWSPISLDQFLYKIPLVGQALQWLDSKLSSFNLGW